MNVLARCSRPFQVLLFTLGSGAVVLGRVSSVQAEPTPLAEALQGDAKTDYEAAKVLYVDGDFAGAYLKFAQAYKKSRDPRLLWNMAAARKGQRRYADVERLVQQYLQEARDLSEADRSQADELLQTIRAFVVNLNISVDEPGASVSVDGEEVGRSPLAAPVRLDLGKHEIRITKAGFEPFVVEQMVAEDTMLAVNLLPHEAEGTLRLVTPADTETYVDGKRVTSGQWSGTLAEGTHSIEVRSAGREPFRTETVVRDGESTTLQVTARDLGGGAAPVGTEKAASESSGSGWIWWTAGVLLLGGAAAGGYFLLKPEPKQTPAEPGTLGSVELPLRF